MIEIELKDGQSGYDAIDEYIKRYWDHNYMDTVIVSLSTSYDGQDYSGSNEIAEPYDFEDVLYQNDWWEGERFIRLFGIQAIGDLDISGGIYTEG